MIRKFCLGLFVLLAGFLSSARADVFPANASFETPNVSGSFFEYNPSIAEQGGAGWTFLNLSGITAGQVGFAGPAAPNGAQYAFLQNANGSTSQIAQTVSGFTDGTYTLSFFASFRDVSAANP